MQLGFNIKRLRKLKKLSREELAVMLSVTPAQISNYETERNKPDLNKIEKLLKIFGVTINELLYNDSNSIISNNQTASNIGRDSVQTINSNSKNHEVIIKDLQQKITLLENTLKDKELIIELLQSRLRK